MNDIEIMEKRQREVYKMLKQRLWLSSDQQQLQTYPTFAKLD
jgi:hypothetical protein